MWSCSSRRSTSNAEHKLTNERTNERTNRLNRSTPKRVSVLKLNSELGASLSSSHSSASHMDDDASHHYLNEMANPLPLQACALLMKEQHKEERKAEEQLASLEKKWRERECVGSTAARKRVCFCNCQQRKECYLKWRLCGRKWWVCVWVFSRKCDLTAVLNVQ